MQRLPDDLRLAPPWTDGPGGPFLGLTHDADVLLVLHLQQVLNLVEFGISEALPRLLALAEAQGSRLWLKVSDRDGVVPCTAASGDELLGDHRPRRLTRNVDAALGQALRQGWPLPNGRQPSHLVWVSDGVELPEGILNAFARRAIPFTLFMPVGTDPNQRDVLKTQRPSLRCLGLIELGLIELDLAEREEQMRQLCAALSADAPMPEPARPFRRL